MQHVYRRFFGGLVWAGIRLANGTHVSSIFSRAFSRDIWAWICLVEGNEIEWELKGNGLVVPTTGNRHIVHIDFRTSSHKSQSEAHTLNETDTRLIDFQFQFHHMLATKTRNTCNAYYILTKRMSTPTKETKQCNAKFLLSIQKNVPLPKSIPCLS